MIDEKFRPLFENLKCEYVRGVPSFIPEEKWSFSEQWKSQQGTLTWGMSAEKRYQDFLCQMDIEEVQLKNKYVLDAGCGNGLLTERIADSGAIVLGADYSTSVYDAHERNKKSNLAYVRVDLTNHPFNEKVFDFVFSSGVLHHTPNTRQAFMSVARTVKVGGKFYLWLYCRPEDFVGRFILRPIADAKRFVVSRLPFFGKHLIVSFYARLHCFFGKTKDYHDLYTREFDHLTPRFRHYHTIVEVSRWFKEAGFDAAKTTEFSSDLGFGMVATRKGNRGEVKK
jgi:SAM-dependent methyltransferase